jgi:hypothetical protein
MQTEKARMSEISVAILAESANSLVVGGGEAAADKLGYDACGAEEKKAFISVPSQDVRGPQKMPAETKAYYAGKLSQPHRMNLDLLELISQERLVGSITTMQAYQTRNSFSGRPQQSPARQLATLSLSGRPQQSPARQRCHALTFQIVGMSCQVKTALTRQ